MRPWTYLRVYFVDQNSDEEGAPKKEEDIERSNPANCRSVFIKQSNIVLLEHTKSICETHCQERDAECTENDEHVLFTVGLH